MVVAPAQVRRRLIESATDECEPPTLRKRSGFQAQPETAEVGGATGVERVLTAGAHCLYQFWFVHAAPVVGDGNSRIRPVPVKPDVYFFSPCRNRVIDNIGHCHVKGVANGAEGFKNGIGARFGEDGTETISP